MSRLTQRELAALLDFAGRNQWMRTGRWLRQGVSLVGYFEEEETAQAVVMVMEHLPGVLAELQALRAEVADLRRRERELIRLNPELGPRDPRNKWIGSE